MKNAICKIRSNRADMESCGASDTADCCGHLDFILRVMYSLK